MFSFLRFLNVFVPDSFLQVLGLRGAEKYDFGEKCLLNTLICSAICVSSGRASTNVADEPAHPSSTSSPLKKDIAQL